MNENSLRVYKLFNSPGNVKLLKKLLISNIKLQFTEFDCDKVKIAEKYINDKIENLVGVYSVNLNRDLMYVDDYETPNDMSVVRQLKCINNQFIANRIGLIMEYVDFIETQNGPDREKIYDREDPFSLGRNYNDCKVRNSPLKSWEYAASSRRNLRDDTLGDVNKPAARRKENLVDMPTNVRYSSSYYNDPSEDVISGGSSGVVDDPNITNSSYHHYQLFEKPLIKEMNKGKLWQNANCGNFSKEHMVSGGFATAYGSLTASGATTSSSLNANGATISRPDSQVGGCASTSQTEGFEGYGAGGLGARSSANYEALLYAASQNLTTADNLFGQPSNGLNSRTSNGPKFYEKWLYNRHYDRQQPNEAIGGFEFGNFTRKYDRNSLFCRTNSQRRDKAIREGTICVPADRVYAIDKLPKDLFKKLNIIHHHNFVAPDPNTKWWVCGKTTCKFTMRALKHIGAIVGNEGGLSNKVVFIDLAQFNVSGGNKSNGNLNGNSNGKSNSNRNKIEKIKKLLSLSQIYVNEGHTTMPIIYQFKQYLGGYDDLADKYKIKFRADNPGAREYDFSHFEALENNSVF